MDDSFVKANSNNLPKIDAQMVASFFHRNPDFFSSEVKHVKTMKSSRESYGDDAVGYVQLLRNSGLCILKCKVCPEHKVRTKPYEVTIIINEEEDEIIRCQCQDCAASAGGCKHAVAFLLWAHRRSEEPSPTSIDCYWRKPPLAKVGTAQQFIRLEELCKSKSRPLDSDQSVFQSFLKEAKKMKTDHCELLKYQPDYFFQGARQFSMHHFMVQHYEHCGKGVDHFLRFMSEKLEQKVIASIEEETRKQSKSTVWYEMRYGRITASKVLEVSRCRTVDGALVSAIMGAKSPDSAAMKRGRHLETKVIKSVEAKLNIKIRTCGIFISREFPMLAASPDGVHEDTLFEVKCPLTEKTKSKYINNGIIGKKFEAQMQLQMFCSGLKKCYFCVAQPDFEKTSEVAISMIPYDEKFVSNLVQTAASFWKDNIFPLLLRASHSD